MKFDLREIDFQKEVSAQLKEMYHKQVDEMIRLNRRESKSLNKVTLYHGTTLLGLNNILLNGLLSRAASQSDGNWGGNIKGNENLVYLTTKWHYAYADFAIQNNFKKYKHLMEKADIDVKRLLVTPCYIEVEVREQDLIIDEDMFHSSFVKDKLKSTIKKGSYELKLTAEECIKNYGTVAHIGNIDRIKIKSFTILGNIEQFYQVIMNDTSKYFQEFTKWTSGAGVGKLTAFDLAMMEAEGDDEIMNLTFQMDQIPEDCIIAQLIPREKTAYGINLVPYEAVKTEVEYGEINKLFLDEKLSL